MKRAVCFIIGIDLILLLVLAGISHAWPASALPDSFFIKYGMVNTVVRSVSDNTITDTAKKAVFTEWVSAKALKWGYVTSYLGYQTLNGLNDGYHFSQETRHIVNDENYHAYATLQRFSGITTGWLLYANVRDKNQKWYDKTRRVIGTALIGRNAFEWSYKAQRYGDPFDYSPEHNEHAIVYFKINSDGVFDAYIGTGKKSGPLVDLGFLITGLLLLK